MSCEKHSWMELHEQGIIGGHFQIGWQCEKCGQSAQGADPWVLSSTGNKSTKVKLVGPHGGGIMTGTGKTCKAQIYDTATKELRYIE